LQDEGTITICNALSESKASKLKELDLSSNIIKVPGANALAALLVRATELTTVWTPAHEPYLTTHLTVTESSSV